MTAEGGRTTGYRHAAALALLIALGACSQGPDRVGEERSGSSRPQDLGLERRLLALHNRERSATGAVPLRWDRELAASAAAYGPELARLGRLAHSAAAARPGQGENLWMGTRGAFTVEEMAGGWAGEKRLFRPGTFPDVSASGKWSDVAHYTQMIWKGTTRLGCAIHSSRDWDFLICRYAPAGNVVGQKVP